jgi:hypothetical protein
MRFGLLLTACSGTFALGQVELIELMLVMTLATVVFALALVKERWRE